MQGWIKLHRKILNHWVADEPECLAVWVRLLIEANHTTTKRLFNGRMIDIERGQLLFGLQRFTQKSGVSIAKLRRYMRLFEAEGMIDRQKDNKYSLITITCYEDFQDSTGKEHSNVTQTSSKEQHYKNVKNVKNDNNMNVVSKDTTTKKPNGTNVYPEEFEWIWERRPPREGTNNKHDAFKAAKARLKQGHTWHEMAQGVIAYTKYLNNSGDLGTRHVLMLRTFLGPALHFKSDWSFNDATNTKNKPNTSAAEQVKAAWAAKQQSGSSETLGVGGEPVRPEVDQGLGDDTERDTNAVTLEHKP